VCVIDLPDAIDVRTYDGLSGKVAWLAHQNDDAVGSPVDDAYRAFGSAWLAVGYRVAAVARYDAEFQVVIARNPGPAGEDRFIQERALFGCIASAVSCIECFFVASYMVGAAIRSKSFPIDTAADIDKLYPRPVAGRYAAAFPSDPFTTSLDDVANSSDFWAIRNLREVLSHRGALLRTHFVPLGKGEPHAAVASNPKELPSDFRYDATLNSETTGIHARWTLKTLNALLGELAGFVERQRELIVASK
jgi:hypothetical protein